jgi:uncharacterized membrane protein
MIGLAIIAGVLCAVAFARHHHRWHHGCARGYGSRNPWDWGGSSWGGPPWGGPPWGGAHRHWRRHARVYAILAELDLSPAQEKLVRSEVWQLAERLRALRPEVKQTRGDVARAVGGTVFDKGAVEGAFARHDAALAELRTAVLGALERIHEALDDHQREHLAELLGRGMHGGWGPGPYRA